MKKEIKTTLLIIVMIISSIILTSIGVNEEKEQISASVNQFENK